MTLTPVAASLIMLAHTMTATYMDVDPNKVPPIKGAYTLPLKSFDKINDCTICKPPTTAIYRERDEKIYIGIKPYYKDRFIFSQLLHETAHHFQYKLNVKNKCLMEEEWHAVKLQALYLQSKGATWWKFNEKKAEYKGGKCN